MGGEERSVESLKEELRVTDALLATRERVLTAIPPCPAHGNSCVPHAEEWIEKAKEVMGAKATACGSGDVYTYFGIEEMIPAENAIGGVAFWIELDRARFTKRGDAQAILDLLVLNGRKVRMTRCDKVILG